MFTKEEVGPILEKYKHLIKEIQNKYKIHENIYNELRKKLNSNID